MDKAPLSSSFTSRSPNWQMTPLETAASSVKQGSVARHWPRTEAIGPVAKQLVSPERPSRSLDKAAESLARFKGFIQEKADRYKLGLDAESAQVPADVPLHPSPEEHAELQNYQHFVNDLVERKSREGSEVDGAEIEETTDPIALAAPAKSNGKDKEEALAATRAGNLRVEESSTPRAMRAPTDFSQLQSHDREIKLLVSTLNYDACTHFTNRACYSGPPGKWTLFDERGSEEVSLVTNVSSQVARRAFSYLTGKRLFTGKAKSLCVMYIEPRNGGEVLVRGLFMGKDSIGDGRPSTTLMRKLCGFFGDFEIAAISPPRPINEPPRFMTATRDFGSEYEVTISFARRWEAETVVEDMHGLEFDGRRLEITLSKPSNRPPPPQHMHLEIVEALDKLLFDIEEGREHFSQMMA